MSVIKKYDLHHTVIPPWIYRIPSELRSQAGLGSPSTVVGDHTGIVSAVCFFIFAKNTFLILKNKLEKPASSVRKVLVQRTNKKILHKKDKPKKTTSLS